ncbi:uncharacterized protein MONBRDRAFT_31594 [Monosiga brevicollis MX1]|uniref:EF-hand domain-containing protein n=1 Tax=Monosiga brevicollis TaxID=81824 RepID=A9UU76_MONBE|nr:uncharacterized protein MONBRDRAFT_31594 [Monosiga brevicollis MX1]EDQ91619.1 predicted protein [Monosiga brevicollis MX1]|eukprot:XP_001744041.1 hypothetical protein [Monosiga brevicollis MX1]
MRPAPLGPVLAPLLSSPATMTDQRRQQYEDAFHIHAGPAGSLSLPQCGNALRSLGFNVSDGEVATSAGGSTNLQAFLTLAQTFAARGAPSDDTLYAAFRVFDKLGNGTVPAKEFAQYSQILGDRLSDAEVAQLMQHANSGSINYEKFFCRDQFVENSVENGWIINERGRGYYALKKRERIKEAREQKENHKSQKRSKAPTDVFSDEKKKRGEKEGKASKNATR